MPSITIKSQDVIPSGTSFSAYEHKKQPGRDKYFNGAADLTGTIGAGSTTLSFPSSGEYVVSALVNGQLRQIRVVV